MNVRLNHDGTFIADEAEAMALSLFYLPTNQVGDRAQQMRDALVRKLRRRGLSAALAEELAGCVHVEARRLLAKRRLASAHLGEAVRPVARGHWRVVGEGDR
jgi:hypothetical protein